MEGVEAHHQLGMVEHRTDVADVREGVVGFVGVEVSLTLGFAQYFHVDENAINASLFSVLSDLRVGGDQHEI
jgi:hypothetical protein